MRSAPAVVPEIQSWADMPTVELTASHPISAATVITMTTRSPREPSRGGSLGSPVMIRRRGAWWMAGVVLPLVLAGLAVIHTVDVGPAAEGGLDAVADPAGIELHGEHDGCDHCHGGLHVMAACVAALGSVAVWRVVHRRPGGIILASAWSARTSLWRGPPGEPPAGRPPWVELGVMLR